MSKENRKEEEIAAEPKLPESKVVTTEEELDSFRVIKAILAKRVDVNRLFYRDAQSYFAILLDDNNRKPICRMYLNSETNKYFCLIDEAKKEVRTDIESIYDLYNYTDQILASLDRYIK